MYVCVMDRDGQKLVHTNIKNNDFDYFLQRVEVPKETSRRKTRLDWYLLVSFGSISTVLFF